MRLIFSLLLLITFNDAKSFEYNCFVKNEDKPIIYNLDKSLFKTKNNVYFNFSILYTSDNHIGFELLGGGDFLIGFGLLSTIKKNGYGTDYSEIFGINTYRSDIYRIHTAKVASAYGVIGVNHKKLTLGCILGAGYNNTFYNGYDNSQILSPSGYWYLSKKEQSTFLYGAQIHYIFAENFSTYFGYDNFNKYKFGFFVCTK